MKTEFLDATDPASPEYARNVARAAELLRAAECVAIPTETVYGLAADATSDAAVAKIYAAKSRPRENPMIVHVADHGMAIQLAGDWPERAARLAGMFWPGPLTMILPAGPRISRLATAGLATVGLRCPKHPVARAILAGCKLPLAAPSANESGHLSPVEADAVVRDLDGRIAAVVDGGRCRIGLESTVLDLCGTTPRVLRPGAVTRAQLAAALGEDVELVARADGPLASPGQMDRHYAPRRPLRLKSRYELSKPPTDDGNCRIFIGYSPLPPSGHALILPDKPDGCASQLYATLRWAEEHVAGEIWFEELPEGDEWEALRDRLRRASTA